MSTQRSTRNRPPSNVQILPNLQRAPSDSLDFLGAELGNNVAPLAHRGGADAQRPGDIRGRLKVIENVLLEHAGSVTVVQSRTQPQFKTSVLTSVHMDKFATLADRLKDAMGTEISASDLAKSCNVSPAAVSKWLDGRTKQLKAETLHAASRALGVREDWLRTGKLPREREAAEEERQIDQVIELLENLRGPLASLASAIDTLSRSREPKRKRA